VNGIALRYTLSWQESLAGSGLVMQVGQLIQNSNGKLSGPMGNQNYCFDCGLIGWLFIGYYIWKLSFGMFPTAYVLSALEQTFGFGSAARSSLCWTR
jgi:hypothetical protein